MNTAKSLNLIDLAQYLITDPQINAELRKDKERKAARKRALEEKRRFEPIRMKLKRRDNSPAGYKIEEWTVEGIDTAKTVINIYAKIGRKIGLIEMKAICSGKTIITLS